MFSDFKPKFVQNELFVDSSFQLNEIHGKMVGKKVLYVDIAQRKEDKQERLQVEFDEENILCLDCFLRNQSIIYWLVVHSILFYLLDL